MYYFISSAMIHSGMGPTHVINFLSTCNIPPIDTTTLKKKEKEISASIVKQAKESCRRAREEKWMLYQTNWSAVLMLDGRPEDLAVSTIVALV